MLVFIRIAFVATWIIRILCPHKLGIAQVEQLLIKEGKNNREKSGKVIWAAISWYQCLTPFVQLFPDRNSNGLNIRSL